MQTTHQSSFGGDDNDNSEKCAARVVEDDVPSEVTSISPSYRFVRKAAMFKGGRSISGRSIRGGREVRFGFGTGGTTKPLPTSLPTIETR